jgi:hypothetical protein
VDSFPHHQRADLIKILEGVLAGLNADFQTRYSVDRQPDARPVLDSASPKTLNRSRFKR